MAILSTRASLRIFGRGLDFDRLQRELGVRPSHTHRRGDLSPGSKQPFEQDMWMINSDAEENAPIEDHLNRLRRLLLPHYEFLRTLKLQSTVDVYLSYISDTEQAGFEVSPESLAVFQELGIPFSVSVLLSERDAGAGS